MLGHSPNLHKVNRNVEYDINPVTGGIEFVEDGLLAGVLRAKDGYNYKTIACVVRNYNDGNGWRLIENASHAAMNVSAVTSDTVQIYLTFGGDAAEKVASLVACPDETLAAAGFNCGSSVNPGDAAITLYKQRDVSDYISYNGSAWVSARGVFYGATFSAGVLTLTHSTVTTSNKGYNGSATSRGDTYAVGLESISATTTQVKFFSRATGALATVADTNMKAYVSRGQQVGAVNPADVHEGTYPGANVWVFGVVRIAA